MEVPIASPKNTHSPIRLPFRRASAIGYKELDIGKVSVSQPQDKISVMQAP